MAGAVKKVAQNATKALGEHMLGTAFNIAMFGGMVVGEMQEGKSLGSAALKAGADQLFMTAMPSLFWGMTLAQVGSGLAQAGYATYQDRVQWLRQNNRAQPRFNYVDTEAAYTMRSAAVQAIQGSKLNARSALGGEARLLQRREAYNTL